MECLGVYRTIDMSRAQATTLEGEDAVGPCSRSGSPNNQLGGER